MNFKDILEKNKTAGYLYLGYNEDSELKINIKKYSSILVTGETGSGKSIFLDQIILQLLKTYIALDIDMILIDPSGVELTYYDIPNYISYTAFNNHEKSLIGISKVLDEIERRKKILLNEKLYSIDEYNEMHEVKIPLLAVIIDDDKAILRDDDVDLQISSIIKEIDRLNILFVLSTNDVYNTFFENDRNEAASLKISFDMTNMSEAHINNLVNSNNLAIGEFLAKDESGITKYHNYEFDDSIIKEVVDKL